ncbi:MAG: SH3 domain-containing protein [Deltaproteobacteria bacterium]|nr:SH3 domain-containing protein [Candidatus Anaeroferrophillus wilburensis]MBN2888305.1 SH3 domain-containing protein [Deltaproteobacteria bacterium]
MAFLQLKKSVVFVLFFSVLFFILPVAVHAERLSVTVPKANIRSGPGSEYDIIWQVGYYYPLQVVKKSGSWCQFSDYEGDTGWINRQLISSTPTVITVKDKCNIRSGPGTGNQVVFTADRGVAFKIIAKKDTWIKVQHPDGDLGWIYQSLVW